MAQEEIYQFLKKRKNKSFSSEQLMNVMDISRVSVNRGLAKLMKQGYVKFERVKVKNQYAMITFWSVVVGNEEED